MRLPSRIRDSCRGRSATANGARSRACRGMALADVAFTMLAHIGVIGEAEILKQDRAPIGNHIYGAFGRDFATADGKRVMVAAISSGQWTSLVKACALEREISELEGALRLNFKREADRYQAREDIAKLVEAWCSARTFDVVQSAFQRGSVCWGQYRTTRDLLANDTRVNLTNPVWERINTPGIGEQLTAGTPLRAGGEARTATNPAPLLGQHTDEVLHDVLGLDSGAIGRLHDAGVVAGTECDRTAG